MSNSVELCPMPLGMPAVRYMAPTPRLFLASLAAFISSTVSPTSAKVWTPALAGVPSSHSWKWRLWLTAKQRWGGEEWDAYSMECISVSLGHHRTLSRRWDHFHYAACVYVYSCLLLPAIEKDDSLEIATWISFAFSRTVTVSSFIPRFANITAAWATSVGRQVRFCWTPPVRRRQQDRPQSWSSTVSLTTKPFYLHSIESLGPSRNSLKNPNAKLFAPQVLGMYRNQQSHRAWASGYRVQIKVSQKQADKYSDGFALPHSTGTHTHTLDHAFILKHFWHMY